MKKLKEIGFVKEVKGKGKYTFISDFNYVKMKVAKLNFTNTKRVKALLEEQ